VALIVRGSRWRWLLSCLAVSYAFAVVAAAEFSTVLGLLVAVVVIVILTKSTRIIGYAIPVAVIGAVFLWPVIEIRLSGFQSASGLPSSWLVRLYNLRTYFWPPLFSDYNWILGVRPSAREHQPVPPGSSPRRSSTNTAGSSGDEQHWVVRHALILAASERSAEGGTPGSPDTQREARPPSPTPGPHTASVS